MTTIFEVATTYVAIECGGCGTPFAMSQEFYDRRRRDHKNWYCPMGCVRHYSGESKEQRFRRELETERRENHDLRYRIDHANRSRAALKGQVTKIKRRVGKGICPCCRRNFANLKRHMEGQHPNWREES